MTSVSGHGGLVHVIMFVSCLTVDGVTALVSNSPKLKTLHLHVSIMDANVLKFNSTLKKIFWNRRLFIDGHYKYDNAWYGFSRDVLWEQNTDLFPLWY